VRIWANFDVEARWSGATLNTNVLRRIGALAPLLAAFAPPGEPVEIWAPHAPARILVDSVTVHAGIPGVWDLAWADPAAKPFNDRRLALALSEELGIALPGARVIESIDELDRHLETTRPDRWVCKAPWTAAARDRAHGHGMEADRVYIARLLERCGAVVFEPWLDRLFDIGVVGTVHGDTVELAGIHTLLADVRGGFAGIDLAPPPLTADESARVLEVARAAGARLARGGYAGPFSVDAFVYRPRLLHALVEINARHTFGHVTRALAARYGGSRLGFGAPPQGARVLVDDPAVTAWLA